MSHIASNLADIRARITRAAQKSGRSASDITLVAVTKTVDDQSIQQALAQGVQHLGENKVQELTSKAARISQLGHNPTWHMIGRLQTNKAKAAAQTAALIHSVDSFRLAQELSRRATAPINILMQVNASGESTKAGTNIDSAKAFARDLQKLPNICLQGLMTIAPAVENPEENRFFFGIMYKISVDIQRDLDHNRYMLLSMGMSSDYEVAIEEGSNIVRIGTGIFGER